MNAVIEYMRELGISEEGGISTYIENSDVHDLVRLVEYLRELIDMEYKLQTYTPFTFVPNDDLSGTGGCQEIQCKIKRAKIFSIFTAMYADNVYIQLDFITYEHFEACVINLDEDDNYEWEFKGYIEHDLEILRVYADLIDAGIVHITPVHKTYCKQCFQKTLLGIQDPIDISTIKNDYAEKVKMVIDRRENDYVVISLKNLDDFFPDHPMLWILDGNYNLENLAGTKIGKAVENRTFVNQFVSKFIEREFNAACYNEAYCKVHNAKFITNKPSDSIFMTLTKNDKKLSTFENITNILPQYDMPFITNINMNMLIKLREEEHESFNKYRIALTKAISEQHKTDDGNDWRQIYDDILFPSFNELDLKMKQLKTGKLSRFFGTIGVASSFIIAGKYGNVVPANIQNILSTIGTSAASAGINYMLDHSSTKKAELQSNDYYFLWTLKNKIK
jgi:hypothetical protein